MQTSMAEIGRRLGELDPGSSAIVGFDRSDAPGHWFNSVNYEGMVRPVDGQGARFEGCPPSGDGLGFDECEMSYSDAIYFIADGKALRRCPPSPPGTVKAGAGQRRPLAEYRQRTHRPIGTFVFLGRVNRAASNPPALARG
jgi:hypothetical protein